MVFAPVLFHPSFLSTSMESLYIYLFFFFKLVLLVDELHQNKELDLLPSPKKVCSFLLIEKILQRNL